MGASFITLKKAGADNIKDFRPISLIESVCKILAKVLASRLQTVLLGLIFQIQGVSVQGRQILDGVLIANERVHSRHRDKTPSILCKLDFQRAYGGVDWQFLMYMLRRMGFGVSWRWWILERISSACFSVLINGSPKGVLGKEVV